MPKIKATKSAVDSLRHPEKGQVLYFDTELSGFGVCVGKSSKTYFVQGTVNNRRVRHSLGRHGVITAEQARAEARLKLADMYRGIDPARQHQKNKANMMTVSEALEEYNVNTSAFGLKQVREIYKAEGIDIHYYPLTPKIKAMYMCEDGYYSVAVQKNLPDEPKIFALIHELKHHYCDQEILKSGHFHCGDFNMKDPIEIGAEIFAAEFIYPIKEFEEDIKALKIKKWAAEDIVNFKKACKAKVSYRYICRRLAELNLITFADFERTQFQKLEYQMYGLPYHLRKKAIRKRA